LRVRVGVNAKTFEAKVTAPQMQHLSNAPIPLDASEQTEAELKQIVCGVNFELNEHERYVRLLGPDMSYQLVDPYLPGYLARIGLARRDVHSYKWITERVDFCFEDSWTGYFIANRLSRHYQDDLTIIHLDDHSDMMPTLLSLSGDVLTDPTTGAVFDPGCSGNWASAILSGAITIGNYMTPLYYSSSRIHVRHIRSSFQRCESRCIERQPLCYDLIPNRLFAAITKADSIGPGTVGSYFAAQNPERVLDESSCGWTIIHIDLDYFVNDLDGCTRAVGYIPNPGLRIRAAKKLERFFEALTNVGPKVDRWIIATSPGFCSAYHWEWLLSEIDLRIRAYETTSR
jgi:hypothetical protein